MDNIQATGFAYAALIADWTGNTEKANEFLQYVSAKRQVALAKRSKKIDKSLPMDKNVFSCYYLSLLKFYEEK